jgi:hypothetical protein
VNASTGIPDLPHPPFVVLQWLFQRCIIKPKARFIEILNTLNGGIAEASEDHPLCETRMGHEGPYYRFPCKLAAIMQLVRLMGWNEPVKVQIIPGVKKMDNWDRFIQCINARYAADTERQAREREKEQSAMAEPAAFPPATNRS